MANSDRAFTLDLVRAALPARLPFHVEQKSVYRPGKPRQVVRLLVAQITETQLKQLEELCDAG